MCIAINEIICPMLLNLSYKKRLMNISKEESRIFFGREVIIKNYKAKQKFVYTCIFVTVLRVKKTLREGFKLP